MSKALALAVTPSIKLRKSQASLYEFILAKHKDSSTITLDEVVDQYTKHGSRYQISGRPAYYRYNYKDQTQDLVPLEGDELKSWALQWFVRNLGVFVVKGLLTALPTMELSDLQIEENGHA